MSIELTELEELIDSTITIGSIPTCLAEIQKILEDPDGTVVEVVGIIEKDPPIAAKVLRLVSS